MNHTKIENRYNRAMSNSINMDPGSVSTMANQSLTQTKALESLAYTALPMIKSIISTKENVIYPIAIVISCMFKH